MYNTIKRLDNMKVDNNINCNETIYEQHASDEESNNMNFTSIRSPVSNSNDDKTISEKEDRTSRSHSQNFTFPTEGIKEGYNANTEDGILKSTSYKDLNEVNS
jgi:hypothetical protein